MSEAIVRSVFDQVRGLFIWAPDDQVFGMPEYWSSFAREVELGQSFTGDCDNFALTCAERCLQRGIKAQDVRIALCWTYTGEYHAVAIAHGWMMDNRQRLIRHWSSVPYRWDKSMRLSEPGIWREARV